VISFLWFREVEEGVRVRKEIGYAGFRVLGLGFV